MKINTCLTIRSFEDDYWKRAFNLMHEDLDLSFLPPKDPEKLENWKIPVPQLLVRYWNALWKKTGNIGTEFLNPSNFNLISLQRIWEFIQTIASICFVCNNEINGKEILSLGAGFEPCLYAFAKLGAKVYASDIYYSTGFWNPELVKYIKETPENFCHYKNFKPKITFLHVNLKSKKDLSNLKKYDIIYSISSLEHIHSTFKKKKKLFKNIIKHLRSDGIFSFTTELTIIYDKTRYYKILYEKILNILTRISTEYIKKNKNVQPNLIFKSSNKLKKNSNKKNLNYLFNSLRKILLILSHLYSYNRRFDFFTIEELLAIIKMYKKKNIYLVEKIDIRSCREQVIKVPNFQNLYRTSISLTFKKIN